MSHKILQVAGIKSLNEAELMIKAGFTHLGYPLELEINEEDLPRFQVRDIIDKLRNSAVHVVITYLNNKDSIVRLLDDTTASWVQIHGQIDPQEISLLRAERPNVKIIKSLIIGKYHSEALLNDIEKFHRYCDYFITDTFNPITGASGATGLTHDWEVSKLLVDQSPKPVILAGGLTPTNVASAINKVKPFGVDVHTGIESETGAKDFDLSKSFVDKSLKSLKAY